MDGARNSATTESFGRFTLNSSRCAVVGPDQREVTLRPKTFAVLSELLAHRGQIVTRESLIAAVWPNVTVGDESLTQCIRELRAAFGADGFGMVRTLPRRGYMLDLHGEGAVPPDSEAGDAEAAPSAGAADPARRWRQMAMPAAAITIVLGLSVWQITRPPHPVPRAEARHLTERANHWYRSEASPAAWRGQRDLYQRATAIDPDLVGAWVGLAFTNANLVHYRHSVDPPRDFRAAEAAAVRAFQLAPSSSEANAAIGAVDRLRPERLDQSLAAYQRALDMTPGDFSARAQLGWMMVQLGRAEDGEILLRAALVLAPPAHPFRPSWYYYLGMIDLMLGRGDHGLNWLQQARDAGGSAYLDAARFDLTMAAALAKAGRTAEAAEQVRQILARQPDLTLDSIRNRPPWGSPNPIFKAQLENVFEGLALAGLH